MFKSHYPSVHFTYPPPLPASPPPPPPPLIIIGGRRLFSTSDIGRRVCLVQYTS
ncbi:hypothetical protein E2C01_059875 [Portunus trituberculatus]|uniref:Uncharacterized protein n=1 Tax=Portunus trituberculatus TaxID=210409 RepID=A0A5B7H7F3_PORTR|nr:hypothetical protein [Portunus trituberculatus]